MALIWCMGGTRCSGSGQGDDHAILQGVVLVVLADHRHLVVFGGHGSKLHRVEGVTDGFDGTSHDRAHATEWFLVVIVGHDQVLSQVVDQVAVFLLGLVAFLDHAAKPDV